MVFLNNSLAQLLISETFDNEATEIIGSIPRDGANCRRLETLWWLKGRDGQVHGAAADVAMSGVPR